MELILAFIAMNYWIVFLLVLIKANHTITIL